MRLRSDDSKGNAMQASTTLKTKWDATAKFNRGNGSETTTLPLRLQFANHLLTVLLRRVELLCSFDSVSWLKMLFCLKDICLIHCSTDDVITLGLPDLALKENDCKNLSGQHYTAPISF